MTVEPVPANRKPRIFPKRERYNEDYTNDADEQKETVIQPNCRSIATNFLNFHLPFAGFAFIFCLFLVFLCLNS